MHRHAYQGRKLSRDAGPRRALVRGQLTSLVLYEKLETTLAKAKEVAPEFDRLVTKAKRGTLADWRAIREVLTTESAVQKLKLELLPGMASRTSGYSRIVKLANRRGDNALMASLSLIVDTPAKGTKAEVAADAKADEPETKAKSTTKKPATKAKAGAKS